MRQIEELERLLQTEYNTERQEYEDLCRRVGVRSRMHQGKCWFPLFVGRSYYNALDQLVVEVTPPDGLDITEHEFEPGKPVAFFYLDGDSPASEPPGTLMAGEPPETVFLPYACHVSRMDSPRMMVTMPSEEAVGKLRMLAMQGILGIQISFDATSHRVMRDALRTLANTSDKNLLHLRDVLMGDSKPAFRQLPAMHFPWLNESQEEAVNRVLCAREVAIVHGPPGTGKTTTLVEAVNETLNRETQVMVCAQSNAAVDWIAEQLMKQGISVLRIGNPTRVSDTLLNNTYERRYAEHPSYLELWSIRKELRQTRALLGQKLSSSKRDSLHNHIHKLQSRAAELEIRIERDTFDQARVIACTLIGSASRVLERRHFSTLFIDEAAQALEPACWAAILHADRVILAGDHCQLPPTVKSREAARGGLDVTLMQKVAKRKPECVSLLTRQYRMHRDIMEFPSQWFYQGSLEAAPQCADRKIMPIDTPLVWIDTSLMGYEETQNPMSQSRLNESEAKLLIRMLINYALQIGLKRIEDDRIDFGIISPYKSQVHLLRRYVRNNPALRPIRDAITVNTVDAFQGQERDVIMISMVRGNDEGRIGFLNDLRRMNVAITRARMKLIVIGDAGTLSHSKFYRRLIEHIAEKGDLFVAKPEVNQQGGVV